MKSKANVCFCVNVVIDDLKQNEIYREVSKFILCFFLLSI